MLMPNVNFIREQRKRIESNVTIDQRVARYTAYGLVAFMLIFVVIFTVHFLLVRHQKKIIQTIDDTKTKLASLSSLEKEYVVYAKKVKLLYAFDKERQKRREAAKFFYSYIPKENVLKEVKNEDKKNMITFQIISPDVFTLLTLLQKFSDDKLKDQGYKLYGQKLTRQGDGTYTTQGSMEYKVVDEPKKK